MARGVAVACSLTRMVFVVIPFKVGDEIVVRSGAAQGGLDPHHPVVERFRLGLYLPGRWSVCSGRPLVWRRL